MPLCSIPDKVRLYPKAYIGRKAIIALFLPVINSKERERDGRKERGREGRRERKRERGKEGGRKRGERQRERD